MKRSSVSRIGAATPIVAYVGSRPISTLATAIVISAARNAFFRPARSPKWPHRTPPIGRARNPTPSTANDASRPANSSPCGKNSRGNTRAAAVPKRKKSNHSTLAPTRLKLAILRIDRSSSRPPTAFPAVVIVAPFTGRM